MNLIIIDKDDYVGEKLVRLKNRRFEHIINVHKAEIGEQLRVGELNGKIGQGTIINLNSDYIDLELELTDSPPKPSNIQIILAMPRPKVFKRLLMDLTTMGVKNIYVIKTWRVEKSFFNSPVLTQDVIKETMILGLEQAKDTIMPKIEIKNLFKPFVEDEIPDIISDTKAIVAHPTGDRECLRNKDEKITLLIGPEGGLIPFEIDILKTQGFEAMTLGNRILRVETVLPYIIGRLS